jgi:hypothetical protein
LYSSLRDIPSGAKKNRLLLLPGLTDIGTTDWILRKDFAYLGFKTFGCIRRGTPEGFPQGLTWETRRHGHKILAIRAVGFDPDFEKVLTNTIRGDIRKYFAGKPCTITGTLTDVELDHRAGNKELPIHSDAVNPATQVADDFMPLCRIINDIKREACKKCTNSGQRPERPPFLGGGAMFPGEGCFGCFWMQPELYK